jgi:hypothetical protein
VTQAQHSPAKERLMTKSDRHAEEFEVFLRAAAMELSGLEISDDFYVALLCYAASRVVRRRVRRLIVNMPPRHLKTLVMSIVLAAWELALRPRTSILIISHSEALALRIATDIRRILNAPWFKAKYSTVVVKGDDRRGDFRTTAGGGVRAMAIFGGVTGHGADLLIVDDPSEIGDARFPDRFEAVNERFDSALRTRLNNPAEDRIVVVQHRLGCNDLSDHLLGEGDWDHLCLPFIAEEDQEEYHVTF